MYEKENGPSTYFDHVANFAVNKSTLLLLLLSLLLVLLLVLLLLWHLFVWLFLREKKVLPVSLE